MSKTDKRTIYVESQGEGTPCWRPVEAEYLGDERFRIVGEKPADEIWPFSIGDDVKCKLKAFQEGRPQLVAHERMNQ